MGITLPSGLTITEAEGRILRFAENEYAYYDGIPSTQPNHITPVDVMVTNAINSNVNTADKIREVHLGLAEACDPILPMIPEETSLLDRLDEGLLKRLFEAACSVRYVLLPVATKVLHRKRPWLIPVLDNVVLKYYLGDSGVLRAQSKTEAPEIGNEVLKKFRCDLRSCHEVLKNITEILATRGFVLSGVRVLEAQIRMETEPAGYYRRDSLLQQSR